MKELNKRELFFIILLAVTALYPNRWIKAFDLIVFLIFFFNWKLIFKVMFLNYNPNTGKKDIF